MKKKNSISLDHRCKHCKRKLGDHQSKTHACPIGRGNWVYFEKDQFFEPSDKAPPKPPFTI